MKKRKKIQESSEVTPSKEFFFKGNHIDSPMINRQGFFSAKPMIQLDAQPWPLNGAVVNNSTRNATVWADSHTPNFFTVSAGTSSPNSIMNSIDVDHIESVQTPDSWFKIGANTVTVGSDNLLHGFKCAVSEPGRPCP